MPLELSLKVVLVVIDDPLVGDGDEDLFSFPVGEVVDSVVDMVVEAQCPLQFEGRSFPQIFLLAVVLLHQLVTNINKSVLTQTCKQLSFDLKSSPTNSKRACSSHHSSITKYCSIDRQSYHALPLSLIFDRFSNDTILVLP